MSNRLCAALLAMMAGVILLRRQGLRWGATEEEVYGPLPGDDLVPHPMLESTRAITIRAPVRRVWPWLVQLGQDRGGFWACMWWPVVDE